MVDLFLSKRPLKILDLDIETRPLSFWVPERPSAEITAIATCWANDLTTMQADMLGATDSITMLQNFVVRYNEADIVTGHYIKKFDLPMINGALMEFGLPLLTPKLASDTKTDMYAKGDIPANQEYLLQLFNISLHKLHMSQYDWRKSNRLDPEGIEATKKRVISDVMGHMLMRQYMIEHNLLKSPSLWRP